MRPVEALIAGRGLTECRRARGLVSPAGWAWLVVAGGAAALVAILWWPR